MIQTNIKISPVDMKERAELGIRAGDTVKVWVKIEEKGKTRLQAFEGLVLSVKHGTEPGATFTVRKVASGVGVERIFTLYSPLIDKIEIVKRAKVRRAKLYFIRDKVAKQMRRILRRTENIGIATKGAAELEEERKRAEEEAKKIEEEQKKQEEAKDTEDTENNIDDNKKTEDNKENIETEEKDSAQEEKQEEPKDTKSE